MGLILEKVARSRWYVALVLATWIFAPEVRRFVDWRSTFHSLSLLSLLPLGSLLTGILMACKDWSLLGRGYRRVATLWLIGFCYAFIIALLTHSVVAATYTFTLFCLPLCFGPLLFAPKDVSISETFNRFANALLILMTVSALYGIYQYAAPPAWDSYWAQQANIEGSQGATVAFGFRIFGTLNSTGPFSGALMLAILLNLPRLSLRRWCVGVAFVPLFIALALTSVRSSWIGVLLGIVVYVAFASRRKAVVASLTVATLLLVGGVFFLSATVRNSNIGLSALTDRINSFDDLNYDNSASVRKEETSQAFYEGLSQPIGLGLGILGVSAKLSGGATVTLDSGYMARFLEMGVVGFVLFIAALFVGLAYTFKAYVLARSRHDRDAVDAVAASIAVQVVFLFFEAISDTHVALFGMFFWAMICIASRYLASTEIAVVRVPQGSRAAPSSSLPAS